MSQLAPVITVDGPSGVGKGTISIALSHKLSWHYLDSGALYRILAYAAVQAEIRLDDEESLVRVLDQSDIRFDQGATLNGINIESLIRTEQAGNRASKVAKHGAIRRRLLEVQRAFRTSPGLVADGRDMGTKVFSDSSYKFYLSANAEERAKRRFKQLNDLGHGANIGTLFREIEERDARDQNRSESPLAPAEDAILIDTSELSVKEVLDQVLSYLPNSIL